MWKVNLPIQTDGLGIDVLISIPKCPFYPSNHPFPLPHLLFGPNICSFFGILPPSATNQKSFLPPIFMGRLSVWHTPNPQKQELLLSGRANGQCKLLAKGRWPLLKPRCCFGPQKCRIGWLCLPPRANRPNNNILPPIPFPHNSIPTPERRVSCNGIGPHPHLFRWASDKGQ
jgi:hypothetical protein